MIEQFHNWILSEKTGAERAVRALENECARLSPLAATSRELGRNAALIAKFENRAAQLFDERSRLKLLTRAFGAALAIEDAPSLADASDGTLRLWAQFVAAERDQNIELRTRKTS